MLKRPVTSLYILLLLSALLGYAGSATAQQGLSGDIEIVVKRYQYGSLGLQLNFTNNGTRVPTEIAYGHRIVCNNSGSGMTSFDICSAQHAVWDSAPPRGGQMFGGWIIAEGPKDPASRYGLVGLEIDIVNRGTDTGWTYSRGNLAQFSAGLQLVAESNTFTHGGIAKNITASLTIGQSNDPGPDGKHVRSYNGVLIEPNAIAAGGRAITITGDITSPIPSLTDTPYGIGTILGAFNHGINTVQATIFDNIAYFMAVNQTISWGAWDGTKLSSIGSNAAGDIILTPGNNAAVSIAFNGSLHKMIVGQPDSGGPGIRSLGISN